MTCACKVSAQVVIPDILYFTMFESPHTSRYQIQPTFSLICIEVAKLSRLLSFGMIAFAADVTSHPEQVYTLKCQHLVNLPSWC